MGASGQTGDDEPITAINVTPLVDIILVLLIIFMVTATFIVSPQIKVELPKAATGETTEPRNFAIVIAESGKYYLDGVETDVPGIEASLKERLENDPELQAVISADKNVRHGEVVAIVDLVRRNGCKRFAINIDPASVEEMEQAASSG
ncbi:MAG: biopolymer transporter ExbD [Deltaproteobacteria bacterium]|nr:biopolymer transporter ExbD [Deltaproteobacteria bacterium]